MASRAPFRRLAFVANAFFLALAPGHAAPAQDPLPSFAFEGSVSEPDGAPASGAVVVSSAGGQTVTDSSGTFCLEAPVPAQADGVHITAVGRVGGNLLASVRVSLPSVPGPVQVGALVLTPTSACASNWLPTFGGEPGTTLWVNALAVFDDGNGPALYAGGEFLSAGGIATNRIVKWDGSNWRILGSGGVSGSGCPSVSVRAMTVYDDGNGPALYVGGCFTLAGGFPANFIARFDGTQWSALGSGLAGFPLTPHVEAMTVFDDGDGPALYVGGRFTSAGGVPASNVARWDGSSWTALGSGADSTVLCLTAHDDGSGPALYAGGTFANAGGTTVNSIARWDGSNWSALGTGMVGAPSAKVDALTVFDDGGGPALYAAGRFHLASGVAASNIAKWDGAAWSKLGPGLASGVDALTEYDDGGGPALYAAGEFNNAGTTLTASVAKWDGSSWSALGSGVESVAYALTTFDDGGGTELYVGGVIYVAGGGTVNNVAKWDGSIWSPLDVGLSDPVLALEVFDDGGGPALYVGGEFRGPGGDITNYIAKWDGSSWASLGDGLGFHVEALAGFDDGGGPALYVGGKFTTAGGAEAKHVARWDGSRWTTLGSGMNASINALTVFDDGGGPALYAGGDFTAAGGATANYVARWDGTSWTALGSGMDWIVRDLAVFDGGGGDALYAGGQFTTAGGTSVNYMAMWNGSSWSDVGGGMHSWVQALTVHDDGGGAALFAGGNFGSAGGMLANHVAKWDGSSWTPLGSGVNLVVNALKGFDDGNGPALYAGGNFTSAGGAAANRLARWDGSSWTALGTGVNRCVAAFEVFDDGDGPAIYIGGEFTASQPRESYIAKWGCAPGTHVTSYCTAGVSAGGCQASLSATGTASATATSGFDLRASLVEGSKDGLFFFGTNGRQANPWGDGTSYQCVIPPVSRAGLLTGSGTNGLCDGSFGQDLNALWCPTCPKPAKNPGAGTTTQAQLWYRDPLNTSNQTTSLSDAIEFVVRP